MAEEFDMSEKAKEVYLLMYDQEFLNKMNGDKSSDYNLRGETDFNFKNGFGHSRLKNFMNYIGERIENADGIGENLLELTHSVLNVSLICKTGNLQNVKGGLSNDRLDTFIWALDMYYKNEANLLFNYASKQNADGLKEYLKKFKDVFDYCQRVYLIDKDFTKKLIDSGKKPVDSYERTVEYISLALEYWEKRASFISDAVKDKEAGKIEDDIRDCLSKISEIRDKLKNEKGTA